MVVLGRSDSPVRDPKEVPDFYGYGSDITVNLDTGEQQLRPGTEGPRFAPRDLWAVLLLLTCGPFVLAWELMSGRWNWRGQMECDVKNQERIRDHAPGCDCRSCCRPR